MHRAAVINYNHGCSGVSPDVVDNKRLAQPAVTDNFLTSCLQEEHQSLGDRRIPAVSRVSCFGTRLCASASLFCLAHCLQPGYLCLRTPPLSSGSRQH